MDEWNSAAFECEGSILLFSLFFFICFCWRAEISRLFIAVWIKLWQNYLIWRYYQLCSYLFSCYSRWFTRRVVPWWCSRWTSTAPTGTPCSRNSNSWKDWSTQIFSSKYTTTRTLFLSREEKIWSIQQKRSSCGTYVQCQILLLKGRKIDCLLNAISRTIRLLFFDLLHLDTITILVIIKVVHAPEEANHTIVIAEDNREMHFFRL